MMYQTCSTQVNLDYGSDSDRMIRRLFASELISPLCAAIFCNSATNGTTTQKQGHRTFIWNNIDATRTGFWLANGDPDKLRKTDLVNRWWNFAIQAPLVFKKNNREGRSFHHNTWEEWMTQSTNSDAPDISDFENHLTLLFPFVRPKGFIEFRSIDGLQNAFQIIPALILSGVLYNDSVLDNTINRFIHFQTKLPVLMRRAEEGLDDDEIYNAACMLIELAIEGLEGMNRDIVHQNDTKQLIDFFEKITSRRKTPSHFFESQVAIPYGIL